MTRSITVRMRQALQIVRIERRRARRRLGRSSAWRTILVVALGSAAVLFGVGAYEVGRSLRQGTAALPLETIHVATVSGFLTLVWVFDRRTSTVMERIEPALLLTSVPTRTVALGTVGTVVAGIAVPLSLPAVCFAAGLAVGHQSLLGLITVLLAGFGGVALAALVGVTLSLGRELAALRSPRIRRYRTLLYAAGFAALVTVWFVLASGAVGLDRLVSWLPVVPITWIADLGLLGLTGSEPVGRRPIGALCLFGVGLPLCTAVAIRLADRIWHTDPVGSGTVHRSRSLLGPGRARWLFGRWVSRPVLAVARKRWLQERRVPRGLLTAGYMLLILPIVYLPLLAAGEILAATPILLAFVLAVGTGLAFGLELLSVEYPALPLTLSAASSRQFVRGTVLAGTAVGAPVTVAITAVAGVGSPLGSLEAALTALATVPLCLCGVTVAAAIGMDVSYRDFRPVPIPFVATTVYSETGRRSFLKLAVVMTLVGLVCLPALTGYLSPVNEPLSTGLGVSIPTVRLLSLVGTVALAIAVSAVSYRRAVRAFEEYTIP